MFKSNILRNLPPRSKRFKHNPKNLEEIKVVKKANDSVIYKTYSRQMSFTMIEREKKLERLHSLQTLDTIPDSKLEHDFETDKTKTDIADKENKLQDALCKAKEHILKQKPLDQVRAKIGEERLQNENRDPQRAKSEPTGQIKQTTINKTNNSCSDEQTETIEPIFKTINVQIAKNRRIVQGANAPNEPTFDSSLEEVKAKQNPVDKG